MITGPALKPADFYHTGIIVPDIAAAAACLSVVSGYEWTKPVEATLSVTTEGGVYEVPFEFVYSLQAPHLELVTEVPGTVWTASPGTATHHLGYWADDLATTARDLKRQAFARKPARAATSSIYSPTTPTTPVCASKSSTVQCFPTGPASSRR